MTALIAVVVLKAGRGGLSVDMMEWEMDHGQACGGGEEVVAVLNW